MSEHHQEAKNTPDSGSGSDHWSQGQAGGAEPDARRSEASAPYHQAPVGGPGPGPGYHSAPPYPYPYPYPPHGYYPPPNAAPYWSGAMPPPGYGYVEPTPGPSGNAGQPGMGHAGAGHGHGARVSDLVNEVAGGGSGLSSLTRMLDLDDIDFWKGALVGAAAVLLLTNGSVQSALFGAGAKTDKTDAAP
ncbi:hypothetical protein [Allochromatium tepidum]|uniref:Uncharacterized protein n=1 Tax=Allochromatium tepidum TaxID=553982 RepID=A0ABM7QNV1_9GAMM|nr:hypothetical protein [Allochromatium tepidum]BCU07363.1 hypothetical protein Atep_20400 [Allochromatium tepidum]